MFFDFAVKKPLPEAESQPRITPRVVIVHTMDGTLLGTDSLFRSEFKLESHFGIGGPTDGADLDGVIFQWMDTDRRADANLDANAFAISIETSDGGDPSRPWSKKQLDALVRLISALCDHHGIPRRICDRADGSGLGWHVMFGAPGPWTPVAKTCPGPVRIEQLKDTVFPAVMGHETPSMTMTPEDDMTGEQARQLEAIFKGLTVPGTSSPEETVNLLFQRVKNIEAAINVPGTTSAEEAFNKLFERVRNIENMVEELKNRL
jgi:N-acetylmuramoyl-L-alanine amidase